MRGLKRTYWVYIIPALLLLAVTLPHLDQGDFRVETAHYGAVGLQAWRNPELFWTLHEHPEVQYCNKPPLVFWIHGLFLHHFGVTLAGARIPTILAAIGCVLITTHLARRHMGRATALASGSILALSYEFFRRTREISLDMWQLFFMLAAIWLWAGAARNRNHQRAWVAGIPLGLALLCKPLMALLIPCILIVWRLTMAAPKDFRPRDFVLFMTVALTVAMPWHLSMIALHGESFIQQYFGHEVAQRMQGLLNHKPWWYYAAEIGRTYWPWFLCLGAALVHWGRTRVSRHHHRTLQAAMLWILAWSLALILFPDKRPRYALPLYPMLAIVCGYGLSTLPWPRLRSWYRKGLPRTALCIVALGTIAAAAPIQFQKPPDPALTDLTNWAIRQDPTTVYSAALSSVDESMIYLKSGYWPVPLTRHPSPEKGSLLIYTDSLAPKPAPGETCVFRSGPYRVIRL